MPTTQLSIPGNQVRGFNYHPSYSTCTYDTWHNFDASAFHRELSIGKKHFPKMNTIRIWLSWNAWCRDKQGFLDNLKRTLDICEELELKVIPVIYCRWHDSILDTDGIYLDHFMPGASWLQKYGCPGRNFTKDLGRKFKDDSRILAWDLCNEPFAYGENCKWHDDFFKYELDWLKLVNDDLRQENITQPVGIGTWNASKDSFIADFVDCFLTHLYFHIPADSGITEITASMRNEFDAKVKDALAVPAASGKPLIVTETCWGSFDDAFRAELVDATLDILRKNDVGFVAYCLYEAGFTDIHRPENGPLSPDIGHLEFIYNDGTLRPGHDVANKHL